MGLFVGNFPLHPATSLMKAIRIVRRPALGLMCLLALAVSLQIPAIRAAELTAGRRPADDAALRFWLENALVQHGFSEAEAGAATGLSTHEVRAAAAKFDLDPAKRPGQKAGDPLLVLPYPGGRHPRIGFLDGAVDPQRETKLSVFAPWADGGYAVADVPEAIWHETAAGRELLYLAHTHVPTIWDKQAIKLGPLEWVRTKDGWQVERKLPNGVVFGTRARPTASEVRLEMWLTNGTSETLRGLVVQNCVMLKGLPGFDQQTNDNKRIEKPYVACHNPEKNRWIISAWEPCHRPWANPPCPCLHSDPKFPDCEPGKTVRLAGWLSFYDGTDIEAELARIDRVDWRKTP
jgi:hypothetical protein